VRHTGRALCAAFAVLAAASCRAPKPAPPDIVLVLIDTLRADRLGCYGNSQQLSPFLDSLAARGHVFRHAYAQSSHTRPSVASLMTSRFESQHGVLSLRQALADRELTLAEVLHGHGYATAGFSASMVVSLQAGFGQGYDDYASFPNLSMPALGYKLAPVRAELVDQAARSWLGAMARERPNSPIFLYLHYMEMHPPYGPTSTIGAEQLRQATGEYFAADGHPDHGGRVVRTAYDAELVVLDTALRRLFKQLQELRVLDRAVVVITADHGEGFGDHGILGHGRTLYDELVHVPLIVLQPGVHARRDVEDVVSLIDVAPTLLELAGIPSPPAFEGRSLCALLADGRGPSPAAAYTELQRDDADRIHERAIVVGTHKLIQRHDGAEEYYDLAVDPGELAHWEPAESTRLELEHALAEARARAGRDAAPAPTRPLDEQTVRDLRALGYVQ
jgi:arylsulfatase A-like enzyme